MNAWIRILEVVFTSRKLKMSITLSDNVYIEVSGNKYASALKDMCTIKIKNIDYSTIVALIDGEFYDVKVWCGYKSTSKFVIFDGVLTWLSNSLDDNKSNTLIAVCGNALVGRYSQAKLNLSLNSGINMYSAISAIVASSGIKDYTMQQSVKKNLLTSSITNTQSAAAWLESFTTEHDSLIVNADSSGTGAIFSLFDANYANLRIIDLSSNNSLIIGGPPQLTKDGLRFSMLPTFDVMCGDCIKFDNSIIDISSSSASANNGLYLDPNGMYLVRELSYELQNRDSNFSYNIVAKRRNLVSSFSGK